MSQRPIRKADTLKYHQQPKPGKIEVIPTKPSNSQRDLSIAYGAGVPVEGHVQTGLCLVLAGLCWSTFRRVRATLNEMP